jgi:hypothetical protein
MFIYIKDISISTDKKINIIKLDHYNKIINIVNYTLKNDKDKQFIVFDLYGNTLLPSYAKHDCNTIKHNNIELDDTEKNIIKNIKFIFLLTEISITNNRYILNYSDLNNIYNDDYDLNSLIYLLGIFNIDNSNYHKTPFHSYNIDYRLLLLLILACAKNISFINNKNIISNFINKYIINNIQNNSNTDDIDCDLIKLSEIKISDDYFAIDFKTYSSFFDLCDKNMESIKRIIKYLFCVESLTDNDIQNFYNILEIIKITNLNNINLVI